MTLANIEHLNLTVENPDRLADLFCTLFNWNIRWSGEALADGYTVHVGGKENYLALYTHPQLKSEQASDYLTPGKVNHVGLVVDDLDDMERKVESLNLTPNNHRDYGVCKSFYFMADANLEVELVMYY